MKTLVPLMPYVPLPSRLALDFAEPTSLPAWGSVRHIVPPQVPSSICSA
jgi:hypothetical protein